MIGNLRLGNIQLMIPIKNNKECCRMARERERRGERVRGGEEGEGEGKRRGKREKERGVREDGGEKERGEEEEEEEVLLTAYNK